MIVVSVVSVIHFNSSTVPVVVLALKVPFSDRANEAYTKALVPALHAALLSSLVVVVVV